MTPPPLGLSQWSDDWQLPWPNITRGVGSTIFRNWPASCSEFEVDFVGQFRKIVDPTPDGRGCYGSCQSCFHRDKPGGDWLRSSAALGLPCPFIPTMRS